jgi:dipeptidyl aminopeptidase/acylaminoacyl peptidase
MKHVRSTSAARPCATRLRKLATVFVVLVATCAFATRASAAEPAVPPPPAAAFGTVPAMALVGISPDGRMASWAEPKGDGHEFVVMELDSRRTLFRVPVTGATKLRGLAWSDERTLLVTVSLTQRVGVAERSTYEQFRTMSLDVGTGKSVVLSVDDAIGMNTGATLVAARTPKPRTVLMSLWDRQGVAVVRRVFEVDTGTGRGRAIATGSGPTYDWAVNRRGEIVGRLDWDERRGEFRAFAFRDGDWAEVLRRDDVTRVELIGVSRDGREMQLLWDSSDGTSKVWAVPLDGSPWRSLVEDAQRGIARWFTDHLDGTAEAVVLTGADETIRWLDAEAEQYYGRVARAFPGKRTVVYGRSSDRSRAIAYVYGPSDPPVYYLVDFRRNTADTVGEEYPGLVGARLGSVEQIRYAARDGLSIPATVTYPPGLERRALPMVVLARSRVDSSEDGGFEWLAQFLATRGYVVLQPRYRGARGLGEEFRRAGDRQWGGAIQDDVSDGVHRLVTSGVADPRRVCIVGAGEGGFVALAGAALTADLYACAVSVNGIADLPEYLGWAKLRYGAGSAEVLGLNSTIGRSTDKFVADRSPRRRVGLIRAPVLLMHGEQDTVVPITQSEAMAQALQAHGKPFEFIRLPAEDHWLSRSPTRVRVLEETERFLQRHLRPVTVAGAAAP